MTSSTTPTPGRINQPRVGIVIPVYNTGSYLRGAIDSALAQSVPVEIVVIDDASTDPETLSILEEYSARPELQLIRHDTNSGLPAGLNTGISAISAPYVFLLGSDDIVEPTYAAEAAAILDRDSDVAIVTTPLQRFGDSDEIYVPDGAPNGLVDMLFQNPIPGVSVCRRADWEAVDGYRSLAWSEDWDFWIRVLSRGGRCVVLPEARYQWRVHSAQITSTRPWQDKLTQQVEMVRGNPEPWIENVPLIMEHLWRQQLAPPLNRSTRLRTKVKRRTLNGLGRARARLSIRG